MTLDEIVGWKDTWAEQLHKREYDSLPEFMEEALWEFFDNGNTPEDFNEMLSFGSNDMEIQAVKTLVFAEFADWSECDSVTGGVEIIVVTNPELGSDCVVGCFVDSDQAELEYPEDDGYVHHYQGLEGNLDG